MYRYQPPKSSCWGHSLRKMDPQLERELFGKFLTAAVAAYRDAGGVMQFVGDNMHMRDQTDSSLSGVSNSGTVERMPISQQEVNKRMQEHKAALAVVALQPFEELLGKRATHGTIGPLTFQECDQCLDVLLGRGKQVCTVPLNQFILTQGMVVTKWNIAGQEIQTNSSILFFYGMRAVISTFLRFETIEHFHYIRRVLEDLGLCKLNEKHLKSVRGRKAKT